MGCLNSNEQFNHWFGNIHLSGLCNRSCYFCIGQHMMALDPINNLNEWPLKNIDLFIEECLEKNITDINLTGSNTDPLLYKHIPELIQYLRERIPGARLGLRTNGAIAHQEMDNWNLFDKVSITITSFDNELYKQTMGQGTPPPIWLLKEWSTTQDIKANVVLCPETVSNGDLYETLRQLWVMGFDRVNLREPYGQPHVGDPLAGKTWGEILKTDCREEFKSLQIKEVKRIYNMPVYDFMQMQVTYWDVHYVEVESVNLYANGVVSTTYPVSKGHCPYTGKVLGQEHFKHSGRHNPQWVYK